MMRTDGREKRGANRQEGREGFLQIGVLEAAMEGDR